MQSAPTLRVHRLATHLCLKFHQRVCLGTTSTIASLKYVTAVCPSTDTDANPPTLNTSPMPWSIPIVTKRAARITAMLFLCTSPRVMRAAGKGLRVIPQPSGWCGKKRSGLYTTRHTYTTRNYSLTFEREKEHATYKTACAAPPPHLLGDLPRLTEKLLYLCYRPCRYVARPPGGRAAAHHRSPQKSIRLPHKLACSPRLGF